MRYETVRLLTEQGQDLPDEPFAGKPLGRIEMASPKESLFKSSSLHSDSLFALFS
jgi:hypothetical protein